MLNIAAVFIGGGLGAVVRYLTNTAVRNIGLTGLPYATFIVNILGCFFIGFLSALFISKINLPLNVKLFATAGFCGGLSTFAAFSVECLDFFNQGKTLELLVYIICTVIVCILSAGLGAYLAGKI